MIVLQHNLNDALSLECRLNRSVGKESACNAGNPSSIPGSERSAEEGIGYPVQYFWALLVAQVVKNPPAMCEAWVQSLGGEDSLEEGIVTHCSVLAWIISMDRRARWATVHKELDTTELLSHL